MLCRYMWCPSMRQPGDVGQTVGLVLHDMLLQLGHEATLTQGLGPGHRMVHRGIADRAEVF